MAQVEALLLQDRQEDAIKLLQEADNEANPEQLRAQLLLSQLESQN